MVKGQGFWLPPLPRTVKYNENVAAVTLCGLAVLDHALSSTVLTTQVRAASHTKAGYVIDRLAQLHFVHHTIYTFPQLKEHSGMSLYRCWNSPNLLKHKLPILGDWLDQDSRMERDVPTGPT